MKQMLEDFDTTSLPEEIIANILKRIPVKSLIRFQCVSKQWKNLLKTPYFIADHLGHSVHDNPSSLHLQPNHRADPFKLCLLDNKKRVREYQNPPLIDSLKCARIIGSSNGLLGVEFDEFGMSPPSLLLWNAAIREVRQIPRTLNDFKGDCILGFGSSPIANDYKIVRAYYEFGLVVNRVEMYSLNTGSWKEVEFENLEGVLLFQETVTANGTIFWYGSKDLDLIVSFDIAKEVFRLIPMHNAGTMLTVYENKLAVLFDTMLGDFQNCLTQLWVMEEGTGASKARWIWTKKFSTFRCPYLSLATIWGNEIVYSCNIEIVPRLRKFIGFGLISETDHEVKNDESKVVISLTNLNTNKFKIFAICKSGYGRYIFNYVESLTPVDHTHIEEPGS